ncbi:MAG: peptide/nickel transport system permease protein [Pseudonocardiales bacterium]|jgi:peptide/nickel transport system permease protein|nr:peptide/nickel transport system permease protein [Pseudonocardiales bacterium]
MTAMDASTSGRRGRSTSIGALVLRRAGSGLLTVWLISVLVFLAVHVLPGNAAIGLLGRDTNQLALHALTKQLGLDRSLPYQYWHWVTGFVTGKWGDSLVSPQPVSALVMRHVANTAVLTLFTMLITVPLAIVVGTWCAVRNGKAFDNGVSMVTLCLSAIPGFAIGVLVIYLLATNVLHVLPAASTLDPTASVWTQLKFVVAPMIAVVLSTVPYPLRMVRASMIDVLQSDFVMMARLKGLPERRVIFRHALRNGLGPMVQSLTLTLVFLTGGIVVVETVFSYPGVGYALVQAVNERDVPVVQTLVVLIALACVLINLISDLAVIAVTPRLRSRS